MRYMESGIKAELMTLKLLSSFCSLIQSPKHSKKDMIVTGKAGKQNELVLGSFIRSFIRSLVLHPIYDGCNVIYALYCVIYSDINPSYVHRVCLIDVVQKIDNSTKEVYSVCEYATIFTLAR